MSFTIASGKVWTTNEVITAQKLNDMLGEATASGLVSSDLPTGYRLVDVAVTEPTPTLGYPWVSSADGYLKLGDGTRFTFDSGVIFLKNNLGITAAKGKAVQLDPSLQDSFTFGAGTGDRNRVFGVVLSETTAGSFAPIMYRGICQVNIVTVSETIWTGTHRNGYSVMLDTQSGSTGDCQAVAPNSNNYNQADGQFLWFGTLLQNSTPGTAWTPTLYWCRINK